MIDLAVLGLEVDSRGMVRSTAHMKSFRKETIKTHDVSTKFGKAASASFLAIGTAATAAVSALIGVSASVAKAKQLGSALAEAGTLIEGTTKQTAFLREESKRLTATYGGTATGKARAFYQAISAGARSVEDAAKTLDVANRLAIGGVTDITTATDGLTTAVNAYGANVLSAEAASDTLFIAMKGGKTTIGELSSNLGQVVPLAASAGVTFEEVTAAMAALTTQGLSTSSATTGLRQVIAAVIKPTQQAADTAKELGIEFDVARLKQVGFAKFLEETIAAVDGNEAAMSQLFGSVEALGAALSFAKGGGIKFSEIMSDMGNKAGATSKAFKTMAEDDAVRLDAALGKLNNVAIDFGTALLTVLVPALEAAAFVVTTLADNSDVLVIGLGVLAASTIPNVVTATVSMVAWLGTAEGMFIAGAVAARGLALALNAIPFIAVTAGLTAVWRIYRDSAEAASNYEREMASLVSIQDNLTDATARYYDVANKANLEAMVGAAKAAQEQVADALKAAQDNLEALKRQGRFLWVDGGAIIEASKEVDRLAEALFDAEVRLSGAENAAENFKSMVEDTVPGTDDLGGSIGKITATTYEAIPALKELQTQFGANAEAMRGVLEIQNELAQADASAGISQLAKDASALASQLGIADKQATDFQSAMRNIAEMDSFQRQSEALAGLASHIVDAAGGIDSLNSEARKVVDNMLAAAIETSGLAQQIAIAEANSTALGASIARIAPQFAPAIGAANQLAIALGGVLSQLGGVARGLASLSPVGNAVAASLEGIGNVFNSVKTGGLRAASTVIGQIGNNLSDVWVASQKSGASISSLKRILEGKFTPAVNGGGAAAKSLDKGLRGAEKATEALQKAMDRPLLTVIDGAANAVGDFVASGLRDFKSLGEGLLRSVTSAISQAVAFAIANPIKVALGLTGGLTGGAAATGGGSGGGLLSGLLGKALGKFGDTGSILGLGGLGGGSGFLGGLGNAISGGLGGLFKLGANAAAAGGGLLASLGAAVPALGLITAAFSFFKKKVTELDAGLRVTATGMDALIETFRTTETRRFWGLSKKVRTNYTAAGADLADPIQQSIDQIGQSVIGLSDVLNLQSANIDASRFEFEISTKGKSDEQIQKEIEAQLGGLADEMAKAIVGSYTEILPDQELIDSLDAQIVKLRNQWVGGERGASERRDAQIAMLETQRQAAETAVVIEHMNEEFAVLQRSGEGTFETLTRLSTSLSGVNTIFDTLGLTLIKADLAGGGLASTIIDAAGGLEQFDAAATTYYQRFYTDAERTEAAFAEVSAAMGALGEVMPATREGFRALVEQADAMGDPVKSAKLIGLAGAFDAVMTSVDAATASVTAFMTNLTNSLARTQIDSQNAARAAGIASARAALTVANNELSNAKTALRAAFGAEKDRLTSEYETLIAAIETSHQESSAAIVSAFEASISGLEATLTDARERLALSRSIADALDSALRSRLFPGVEAQRMAQDKATDYLAKILSNGEANDIDKLNDALSAVSSPASDTYRTLEEYRLDFDRQTAIISQLKDNADIALTADEMMVQSLDSQIAQAQENHDAHMAALEAYHAEEIDIEKQLLDQQLAGLDAQMSALLGIDTSVLSIGAAINNLASAVSAQVSASAALRAAEAVPVVEMPKSLEEIQRLAIEQIYNDELGRASDATGMAFYLGNLVAGKTDIEQIASNIARSTEALAYDATGIPKNVPGFASGGDHMGGWRVVGERGPELEYTGPSRVFSNPASKELLSNRDVVEELRSLKPMLLSIARSTNRTAADLDKWDDEGLPGTASGEVVKTEVA